MMSNTSGIYCIKNLVNDKIYIGSSYNLHKRKLRHFNELSRNIHPNIYLQNSYNKYGIDNFEFSILEICDINQLRAKESDFIKDNDCCNRLVGYNILKDPEDKRGENAPMFGKKHNIETIDKMKKSAIKRWENKDKRKQHSEKLKEIFKSEEIRKDISIRMRKLHNSDSKIKKVPCISLSERNRLNWKNPEYREKMIEKLKGRKSWNFGISMSEETKKKISIKRILYLEKIGKR